MQGNISLLARWIINAIFLLMHKKFSGVFPKTVINLLDKELELSVRMPESRDLR